MRNLLFLEVPSFLKIGPILCVLVPHDLILSVGFAIVFVITTTTTLLFFPLVTEGVNWEGSGFPCGGVYPHKTNWIQGLVRG